MSAPLVVVTAATPERTRRWHVLVASTGLRVHRRGDDIDAADLPIIAVYIDDHDAWLSWAEPCDRTDVRRRLRLARRRSEQWLSSTGRQADDVAKHRAWDAALTTLCDAGFGVPGSPGDAGWVEIRDRDELVDWRMMADAVK